MEKKKTNISTYIYLLLIILVGSLTVYKIIKNHESKMYDVLYSEIEYKAKRCYLEKKCEENITLSQLYEKKYLDIKYDPISKEELSKDMKITIKEDKVIIDK